MPKRTYQPSKRKRNKTHGFMSRSKDKKRKLVIKKRIQRRRKRIV